MSSPARREAAASNPVCGRQQQWWEANNKGSLVVHDGGGEGEGGEGADELELASRPLEGVAQWRRKTLSLFAGEGERGRPILDDGRKANSGAPASIRLFLLDSGAPAPIQPFMLEFSFHRYHGRSVAPDLLTLSCFL
uniref:Uncharacterized protein n=1 Tax=Oryza sativa subsp. japonica TaxID=39947 RepID=Q5Z788_ORYSJ|nr:hypothetical protein [Oryza sativa Japonica Group]